MASAQRKTIDSRFCRIKIHWFHFGLFFFFRLLVLLCRWTYLHCAWAFSRLMEFLFDKEFSLEIRTALVRSMILLLHLCGAYELTDNNFQIKSSVCTALQARSQSKRGVSIYCRNFEFCFCIHRIVCDEPSICWTRRGCVCMCVLCSFRQAKINDSRVGVRLLGVPQLCRRVLVQCVHAASGNI